MIFSNRSGIIEENNYITFENVSNDEVLNRLSNEYYGIKLVGEYSDEVFSKVFKMGNLKALDIKDCNANYDVSSMVNLEYLCVNTINSSIKNLDKLNFLYTYRFLDSSDPNNIPDNIEYLVLV